MHIKIIEGTTIKGKVVNKGTIHEVDDSTGQLLISQNQAVKCDAPKPDKPSGDAKPAK